MYSIQYKYFHLRCTDGEYTRDQVQASRGQFAWKVVEPYDGAAAMDWVSWDSVGMADRVEWKHKVWSFIIITIVIFGSDRRPRSHYLCPSVCLSVCYKVKILYLSSLNF